MNNTTNIKENPFLIEPLRYVSSLRKNIWIVFVGMFIFTLIGIAMALKKESKSWSATSKIIRYDKKISTPSDIPYQFQDFNYETALETIRTRANLLKLIEKLELQATPESLFSKFEIKRGRNSDIIEIIFTTEDKVLAAKGANELGNIFIQNFFTIQNAAIEKISNYYEKSKSSKILELQNAKKDISLFLSSNNLVSLENELQMKYDQLNIIQLEKLQNQTTIETLKTTINEITIELKSLPDEVKLRYAVRSANKKGLEQKRKELQRMKKKYTPAHPKIKTILSEIAQIKKTMREVKSVAPDEITYGTNPLKSEITIQYSKTKIAFESAKNRDFSLTKQIENLKQNIADLSMLHKKYDQLIMKKNEAKNQLQLVSNRLYDLKMTIESSKEDFKFFEKAQEPKYPKKSYKKVIVIMLSILGFVLSIIFIIIKEFLNNSVKTKFDLRERFGIKELVQLPVDKVYSKKIKHSFSYLANSLIAATQSHSHLISVGSDIPESSHPNVISLLLEQLNQQKKRTLHVEITSDFTNQEDNEKCMSLEKLLLNATHINENIDKAYWCIEDDYSIYTPDVVEVDSLIKELKNLDYDYVLIQAPAYSKAEHLIPLIVEFSDTFILSTKFGVSSRKVIHKLMKRIEHLDITKIKGIINEAHKYFLY